MSPRRIIQWVGLACMAAAVIGCADVDRLGGKMDMAANHISEPAPYEYQGRLQSKKQVGPMLAMEFTDGTLYDIDEASPGLLPGDVVRVYKREKGGYEARLWVAAKDVQISSAPAPGHP